MFDREAYSPEFFQEMRDLHIACLTYHKYPKEDWRESEFTEHVVTLPHGEQVRMKLAERGTWLGEKLWVREIRKLTDNGHQVSILTANFLADMTSIAAHMFARWSQENFFQYMMQHFAIDRLADYQLGKADETVKVVNPAYRKLEREIKRTAAKLSRMLARFGAVAGANLAARICPRVQRLLMGGLGDGLVTVFPPMGLDEHAIDLFEVHDAGLVAHRLDQSAQAEVAGAAQETSPRSGR